MTEHIQAGKFKVNCMKLLGKVQRTKRKIIITKRNKPVAKLVPIEGDLEPLFGKMKGTVHILGDIIAPIDEAHVEYKPSPSLQPNGK